MKKTYNKPTAEKLAFKYRDQVVAASNGGNGGNTGGSGNPWVDGFKEALEFLGICQYVPGL